MGVGVGVKVNVRMSTGMRMNARVHATDRTWPKSGPIRLPPT